MAQTWGVTPEGYYRPTFTELVGRLEVLERAGMDPDLDLGSETILGQHNGVTCAQYALAWEAGETIYHGMDPDSAEGALLENIAKLSGTLKLGPIFSTVIETCVFSAPVDLESYVHFVAVSGREDVRFTPLLSASYAAGSHDIAFQAENSGPVEAPAGDLNVIVTPVVGWASAINAEDATVGQSAETTEELRHRRDDDVAATGGSTAMAIRADLLQLDPENIQSVRVLTNNTAAVDVNGLPPHSYEAIIYDGGIVDNDLIAQTIFESGPDGIQAFGELSGTATDPVTGETVTIGFTRATELPIYILATFDTISTDYVGDVYAAQAWADALNLRYEAGDDVIALYARSIPLGFEGVTDVPVFAIGATDPPTLDVNVPITVRQIARFAAARIEITS